MKTSNRVYGVAVLAGVAFILATLVGSGCRPPFPKCRDDGDCSAEEGNTTLMKCCNEQCQECCQDGDCPKERPKCKENRCVECVVNEDCPAEKPFCENEKCVYECETDADCFEGMECKDHHCVPKCKCQSDADCPEGMACSACECITVECKLEAIHFDFDKYNLRSGDQRILDANADCLKKRPDMKITIEGHCDDRGTEEYNIALGDKRARSALKYLLNLGITQGRLNTISYGEGRPVCGEQSEDCWERNRRDEFVER